MEKIKNIRSRGYSNHLTNELRALVKEKLGVLDTATSFMYFFRRFGMPNETNKDEYKILYGYTFKFKEIIVCVHASYHEHVYFNFLFPSKYIKPFFTERTSFYKRIAKQSLSRNIIFMPFASLYLPIEGVLTERQKKLSWEIINEEAAKFYPKEELNYIEALLESEDRKDVFSRLDPFEKHLHRVFISSLSKKDRYELKSTIFPRLSDVPEVKKQVLLFINELKKGVYVRDVPINVLGYESDSNVIKHFVKK